ncbi:unnamed protein product [Rotaria sp. Silwood2]|nr:unnamed protein product [Rotaria sp. Silwood2]CAF4142299.1 unnamed protein product [Rotaria sp. Silwood2]
MWHRLMQVVCITLIFLYQMGGELDFRALLLKIQDLLSDNDRHRFLFLLGEDVPRYMRDDPSLSGTLRVLESLFEKAIISDQDCDYLIKAFKKIHCNDAAKRLQGYSNCDCVCVWEDNFDWNGVVDPNKWDFDVGGDGWGNEEQQNYTNNRRENARCELFPGTKNGRLIVEARRENMSNTMYTSARLKSKASWTYGRLQIRAKLPDGRGLWPALWMLPQNETYGLQYWPDNGAMNLIEQVGYDPLRITSSVNTYAYNHMRHNTPMNSIIVRDAISNFKIYTLDWNENKIEMFVGDDTNQFANSIFVWNKKGDWTQWPFDKPFFLLINIAVGGRIGGQQGIDNNIFPRRMEIDWVRLYQRR